MEHIEKLTPETREALDYDKVRKMAFAQQKTWISYPIAQSIIEELEYLFHHARTDRMPNLAIVGDTNNGKTTILDRFVKMHPKYVSAPSNIWPVIKFTAPLSPSENALYEKILDTIRAPYGKHDPASRKEVLVIDYLTDLQTRMIIIDEMQDVVHGYKPQQNKFLAALRQLGSHLQISVVAAGVPSLQKVLRSDPQIANRFDVMRIPRWKYNEDFLRLLVSLERTMPFREPSNLHHPQMASRIYEMTEGYIGEVVNYLRKAAVFAIRRDREKIDISVLNSVRFEKPSERRR